MNTIQIKFRDVYGQTKAYPMCEKAKTFAAMLNTKTLTPDALKHIQKLGFEVVCVDAFGLPPASWQRKGRP